MDITRATLQKNVSDQQARIHREARQAPTDRINQQMVAEECWGVDGFADKLQRTPGANTQEIKAASEARATKRSDIVALAGPALASTLLIGTTVLHGPALFGIGAAVLSIAGGLFGRHLAHKAESEFQQTVDTYSKPAPTPVDFESKADWNLSSPPRRREPSIG